MLLSPPSDPAWSDLRGMLESDLFNLSHFYSTSLWYLTAWVYFQTEARASASGGGRASFAPFCSACDASMMLVLRVVCKVLV